MKYSKLVKRKKAKSRPGEKSTLGADFKVRFLSIKAALYKKRVLCK